ALPGGARWVRTRYTAWLRLYRLSPMRDDEFERCEIHGKVIYRHDQVEQAVSTISSRPGSPEVKPYFSNTCNAWHLSVVHGGGAPRSVGGPDEQQRERRPTTAMGTSGTVSIGENDHDCD